MKDLEYKKLLAEVLGKVDERLSFNLDIPDDDNEDLPDAFTTAAKRKPAVKAATKAVADNTPDNSKLTNSDFQAAYMQGAEEEEAATKTKTGMKKAYRDEIDAIQQDVATARDKENLTTDFENTVVASDDIADEFYTPDINKIKSATTFDDLSQSFKKFNAFTVKAPQSMIEQFNKIEGKGLLGKFVELSNFGKAIQAGEDGARKWIDSKAQGSDVKASRLKFMNYAAAYITYADMSKHISGNEAGYAFEKYLALLLSAPILGGANGAVDNVAKITGTNPVFMSAKFMAGASVKEIKQSITGAEGIEAVVVKQKQPVYYLAMAKLRGTGFDDNDGRLTDLGAASKAAGIDSVSTSFDYLALFLIKIAHDGTNYTGDLLNDQGTSVHSFTPQIKTKELKDKNKKPVLDSDGNPKTIPDQLYLFPRDNLHVNDKGTQSMDKVFTDFANGNLGGFLIPTPVLGAGNVKTAEELATLTAAVVSEVAKSLNDEIINSVRAIYKALQATQNDTRSYVAIRSAGSPNAAAKYVTDISDKYTTLFSQYGNLFGTERGTGDDSVFGDTNVTDAMKSTASMRRTQQTAISEIKKLTEEILKEILQEDE